MEGLAEKYVERYCALAGTSVSAFKLAETPCMDNHQCSFDWVPMCEQIVGTCWILTSNVLWTVTMLTRSVTRWNKGLCQKIGKIDQQHQ